MAEDDSDAGRVSSDTSERGAKVLQDATIDNAVAVQSRGNVYCGIKFHEANPLVQEKYKNKECPFKMTIDLPPHTTLDEGNYYVADRTSLSRSAF